MKMNQEPSDAVAVVFNGFLDLSMKEKISLVNILNDFFDHPDKRGGLRRENEERVAEMNFGAADEVCGCCRR